MRRGTVQSQSRAANRAVRISTSATETSRRPQRAPSQRWKGTTTPYQNQFMAGRLVRTVK